MGNIELSNDLLFCYLPSTGRRGLELDDIQSAFMMVYLWSFRVYLLNLNSVEAHNGKNVLPRTNPWSLSAPSSSTPWSMVGMAYKQMSTYGRASVSAHGRKLFPQPPSINTVFDGGDGGDSLQFPYWPVH